MLHDVYELATEQERTDFGERRLGLRHDSAVLVLCFLLCEADIVIATPEGTGVQ